MTKNELLTTENIQSRIYTIRGAQVMLDEDLAALYHVETRVLNQAVKRNKNRFPEQFCFQLTVGEYERLRSQIVTLENDGALTSQNVTLESRRGKHRKYLPYAKNFLSKERSIHSGEGRNQERLNKNCGSSFSEKS
jgi:hypothetical protein